MLHHPCIISVVYPSTRWHIHETNLRYWLKVFALRKAYLEKDVDAYLMMIERPYRVPEFIHWCLHDQEKTMLIRVNILSIADFQERNIGRLFAGCGLIQRMSMNISLNGWL